MNKRIGVSAAGLLVLCACLPVALAGQAPNRQGFFADLGLGYGRVLAVESNQWLRGPSGRIAVGTTIDRRWLLGVQFAGGLVTPRGDDLGAVAILGPVVRYVVDHAGYWVVSTSLGLALKQASDELPGVESRAFGISIGLGYERAIGSSFGIAPYSEGQFSGAGLTGMRLALGVALAWY